ncbi:MAG: RNA polymerase sigma factor [Alistipes sp.]|nr:RNA polymerase sigma factor [Alistipes sp.]
MKSEELNIAFIELKDVAYRYAVSLLGQSAEAEDAVQDLYERLWRRRLLIRSGGFRALLMTSLRNLCLDRLREKERRRTYEPTDTPAEESPTADKETTDIVKHLIEQLPTREREVIHLRDCEGWQFEDIAAVTGASEAAVRVALSRAREKIRDELSKIMDYGL